MSSVAGYIVVTLENKYTTIDDRIGCRNCETPPYRDCPDWCEIESCKNMKTLDQLKPHEVAVTRCNNTASVMYRTDRGHASAGINEDGEWYPWCDHGSDDMELHKVVLMIRDAGGDEGEAGE